MVTSKTSQNVKDKTVSVIMAVYNTEKYLSEAIESVLDQTCSDFEFIIIDDASTDNSLKIIRQYELVDSRIKVFKNESNLGISKSRNKGLAAATGEFVANVDSDDISFTDRFEKQIQFFTQYPDTLVLGGQLEKIDHNGNEIDCEWTYPETIYRWDSLTRKSSVFHACMMARRSYLVSIGGYPEGYENAIDRALFQKMALRPEFCMRNIMDPLIKYRIHSESTSVKKRKLQLSNSYEIRKKALETLLEQVIPNEVLDVIFGYNQEEIDLQLSRNSFITFEKILQVYKKTFNPDIEDWNYSKKDFVRRSYKFLGYYPFQNKLALAKLFLYHPEFYTKCHYHVLRRRIIKSKKRDHDQ